MTVDEEHRRTPSSTDADIDLDENEENEEEEEEEYDESDTEVHRERISFSEADEQKVSDMRAILPNVTKRKCLSALNRCQGDVSKATTYLLDEAESINQKQRFSRKDEESRQLERKMTDVAANSPDALDNLCDQLRHRLILGDQKLPWLDGNVAVCLCRKAVYHANGDITRLRLAQRDFLQQCLVKCVSIMLDQDLSPGDDNYFFASNLVDNALHIALLLIQCTRNCRFAEVLGLVLNPSKKLWRGGNGLNELEQRRQLIIDRGDVLPMLESVVSSGWCGADTLGHILCIFRLLHEGSRLYRLACDKISQVTVADQSLKSDRALENVLRELVLLTNDFDDDLDCKIEEVDEDVVSDSYKSRRQSLKCQTRFQLFEFWYNEVALRLMRTNNLEQRLYGLSQMERLVDATSVYSSILYMDQEDILGSKLQMRTSPRQKTGVLGLKSVYGNSRSSLVADLDEDYLVRWMHESKLFDLLMDPDRMHSEILSRSRKILRFLIEKTHEFSDEIFPSEYLTRMWVLGVSQHESIRQAMLDLIVELFEAAPYAGSQIADFLRQLLNVPKDQFVFVVDLLGLLKKKLVLNSIQNSQQRVDLALQLTWSALLNVNDATAERCYNLFADIVTSDLLKSGRVNLLGKVLSTLPTIERTADGSRLSLRLLMLFRRLIDSESLGLLLQDDDVNITNDDKDSSVNSDLTDDVLIKLLIDDLATRYHIGVQYRIETLVTVIKMLGTIKRLRFKVETQMAENVVQVLSRGAAPDVEPFLFLDRLLKSNSLSLAVICDVFLKIVCVGWNRILLMPRTDGSFASVATTAWNCFRDYYAELGRFRDAEDRNVEDALRQGRECIWNAALSSDLPDIVSDLAVKLSTEETVNLEKELPELIARLEHARARIISGDITARALAMRCFIVLLKFSESDRYVQAFTEPPPHSSFDGLTTTKLILQLPIQLTDANTSGGIGPNTVNLTGAEPNPGYQEIGIEAPLKTCVRDVILYLRNEHHVCCGSLMISNEDASTRYWTPLDRFSPINGRLYGQILSPKQLSPEEITTQQQTNVQLSARMVLARSDSLFGVLHDLQELGCVLDNQERAVLQQLLLVLPSRRFLVGLLNAEMDKSFWSSFLAGDNHAALVYRLELIHAQLVPASIIVNPEHTKLFKVRFLSSGGLRATIDFITKRMMTALHQSELAYDGRGYYIAAHLIVAFVKELGLKIDDTLACIEFLKPYIDAQPGDGTILGSLLESWNPETTLKVRTNGHLALMYLLNNSDPSVSTSDTAHCVLEKMVEIARSNRSIELRDYAKHCLQSLCRNHACHADFVWCLLTERFSVDDKWEVLELIWIVWKERRQPERGVPDASAVLNRIVAYMMGQSVDTLMQDMPWLIRALELIWRFLSPFPSGSVRMGLMQNHSQGIRTRMIANAEIFLKWLADNLALSPAMARHKVVSNYAFAVMVSLCFGDGFDAEGLEVVSKCHDVLSSCLRTRMESTPSQLWSTDPDQIMRPHDFPFVGLVNQGATCYMNSLLQQFFLSPALRKWIISANRFDHSIDVPSVDQQTIIEARDVHRQVVRVFKYLESSDRKCIDPRLLVEKCKTLNLSNPVDQQNDARDLCDKLVDRLEIAMRSMGYEDPTRSCFGGQVIHQNIKKGCPHPPTERADDFIALELQIKGKHTLENSLRDFCAGEVLDGENKVRCDDCGEKYPALLRDCLSDTLPNVLVLHLKRFELDYDTFQTVKVNESLSFPMRLDMAPYTREGLSKAEQNMPIPVCNYSLCGVLVHRGMAGGGHYYSFAKDRTTQQWFKFNDERVHQFDPKKLDEECFGGTSSVVDAADGNAYMLFYEKEEQSDMFAFDASASDLRNEIDLEIEQDNRTLASQMLLCSPELSDRLQSVLHRPVYTDDEIDWSCIPDETITRLRTGERKLAEVAVDLFFNWTLRASKGEVLDRWSDACTQRSSRASARGEKALPWMLEDEVWFANMLVEKVIEKFPECSLRPPARKGFLRMAARAVTCKHVKPGNLAAFLAALINVLPEASKSIRVLPDLVNHLWDIVRNSSTTRALLREEEVAEVRDGILPHALGRLLHITLGDDFFPFVKRQDATPELSISHEPYSQHTDFEDTDTGDVENEVTALIIENNESGAPLQQQTPSTTTDGGEDEEGIYPIPLNNMEVEQSSGNNASLESVSQDAPALKQPVFKPLGWTWTERMHRWNTNKALSTYPLAPIQSTPTMTESVIECFQKLYDCIGLLITPIRTLPPYLKPLFSSPSGPFYAMAVKEGFYQSSVREWLAELCEMDTILSPIDNDHAYSFRILSDLVNYVTRPTYTAVMDPGAESARYDACVIALERILAIEDRLQSWRIQFCLKPEPSIQSSQATSSVPVAVRSVVTPNKMHIQSASVSGMVPAGPPPLEGLLSCVSPMMRRYWGPVTVLSGTFTTGVEKEALYRLSDQDATMCERQAHTIQSLVQNIPAFADALKRHVEQQKREVGAGEDDLTRLVYWLSGHSLLLSNRLRKRNEDSDNALITLAEIASIPAQFVSGRVWHASDPLPVDDSFRSILGAVYLFDDKAQYSKALAYVIDYPVRKAGTIVEFACRMGARFTYSANHPLNEIEDQYMCVVLGKRPGDDTVRMKEQAHASGNLAIQVFDRVQIPALEVRKRKEMVMRFIEESAKKEKENADEDREESDALKKDRVEVGPPPSTVSLLASKPLQNRQDEQTTRKFVYGVVVKIINPQQSSTITDSPRLKQRSIVVRLDGSPGITSSRHSQLIELGEVPHDDPMVLEFSEDVVQLSDEPLSLIDHQFTIARVSPIPRFNVLENKLIHARPLELAVLPGERIAITRHSPLGFAWSTYKEFDHHCHAMYFSAESKIVPSEGSVLGTQLTREMARPAFHFKIASFD